MNSPIETRGLTRNFGSVPGVVDLDLKVEAGEIFGFLGPNGAGKSTTIRLLLDLLRPDRGSAHLFGKEVRAGGGALRKRLGYLPGDLSLFGGMSGRRTLKLFAGLCKNPTAPFRDEVLERLSFAPHALDRPVKAYSTGMRQKIGIACAFQHGPELLILDEPTTGLDPLVRDAFLSLVKDRREAGATVFLSSHVLDEIDRVADRVALVSGARLQLVESVEVLRASRPRTVILRYEDGRRIREMSQESPEALMQRIDHRGLMDIEIRPASMDEVFKSMITEGKSS